MIYVALAIALIALMLAMYSIHLWIGALDLLMQLNHRIDK